MPVERYEVVRVAVKGSWSAPPACGSNWSCRISRIAARYSMWSRGATATAGTSSAAPRAAGTDPPASARPMGPAPF